MKHFQLQKHNDFSPIYLISLPRSGSTLVQRVLASHPAIDTTSEPWLLLPYLYTLKEKGLYTEYSHKEVFPAIEAFIKELPRGEEDYLEEMSSFILALYRKATKKKNVNYFLDKTPRYHLVLDEIMRLFPDAKYIFLWRNPLAIAASRIETWAGGKWNLYRGKVDLYEGLTNLITTYEKYSDRILAVNYENLLNDPTHHWKNIFSYLNLEFDSDILTNFPQIRLKGQHGDPTGVKEYSSLSREPIEKWKKTLNNPIRKKWATDYLQWIGEKRLSVMGYQYGDLIKQLNDTPTTLKFLGSDFSRIIYGNFYCIFEPFLLLDKIKQLPEWRKLYAHR